VQKLKATGEERPVAGLLKLPERPLAPSLWPTPQNGSKTGRPFLSIEANGYQLKGQRSRIGNQISIELRVNAKLYEKMRNRIPHNLPCL
jgi:hypothetical protein